MNPDEPVRTTHAGELLDFAEELSPCILEDKYYIGMHQEDSILFTVLHVNP